jgi:subtilisin family serine protease
VRRAVAVLVVLAALIPTALMSTAAEATPRDAVRDREYWLDDYGIRDAWAVTRGAGVTIAIIDTGVAGGVRDLAGAVTGGADFSGHGSPDGQTPVGDEAPYHGTMVAALAAGRGTGGNSGIIGAAPEASILSISIGLGDGIGDSDQQVADAVVWAVDNGADVINMSFTRNQIDWPESWDDAFLYAAEHDVVIVAAAGNRGSGTEQVGAPATMPGVLTVAGVDRAGVVSGKASSQGITIGVAAPSEALVGVRPDGRYLTWAGTSGAAPIVAGIVALVRAAHPELDAANVINRVIATARDAGPPGDDFSYGYGYIDALAAVSATVPDVVENPMGDLAEWVRIHRRADVAEPPVVVVVPELEAVPEGEFTDPTGVLLPRMVTVQLVGAPLLAIMLLTLVVVVFLVAAVRRIRARSSR